VYDDTPIHVYMAQIKTALGEKGRVTFRELFRPGMPKSALIGVFLAVLELIRHHQARAEQNLLFGELWITPGPKQGSELDVSQVDSYEHKPGEAQ
jgi:segregation and condensation protein A